MSHGLDRFEESALRSCLYRSTYRDQNSTSQFVKNPLFHLELSSSINNSIEHDDDYLKNPNESKELRLNSDNFSLQSGSNVPTENFESNELNFSEHGTQLQKTNPIYLDENNFLQVPNSDSGMGSIESNEVDYSRFKNAESQQQNVNNGNDELLAKLSSDTDGFDNNNSIYSTNGKKYWILNSQKFHTFGGIKQRKLKHYKNNNEYKTKVADNNHDDTDFSMLKFQTFGGIKYKNRISDNISFNCAKTRPSVKNLVESSFSLEKKSDNNQPNLEVESIFSNKENSLRLEPPLVPTVVDRSLTNLIDLRKSKKKNKKKIH